MPLSRLHIDRLNRAEQCAAFLMTLQDCMSRELYIKLSTFHADVTAELEDRAAADRAKASLPGDWGTGNSRF